MNPFFRWLDHVYARYPHRTTLAIVAAGFVVAVVANVLHVPIGVA